MNLSPKQKKIGAYAIGGVVIGGALFIGYKKLSKRIKVSREAKNYNKSTVITATGPVNVIETAQELANKLGVSYSWYDPRSWSEDDTDVRDILLKFPKTLMPKLVAEYAKETKRSLQKDTQKLLPDSYYAQIRSKFL